MTDVERAEHLEELARAEEGRAMRMESDDLHDSLIAEVRMEAESLRAGAAALRTKGMLVEALEGLLAGGAEKCRSLPPMADGTIECTAGEVVAALDALAEARKVTP